MPVTYRARQWLALVFGALLTAYSVIWMWAIRQQPAATFGFEAAYSAGTSSLELLEVLPGSPAEAAGLLRGDRILAIDGRPFDTIQVFHAAREQAHPDQRVRLTTERDGARREFSLTLQARPSGGTPGAPTTGMQIVLEVMSLYPLPFLIVGVAVLLQRPDSRNAWLLALMLGGFITAAPIMDMEWRIPSVARGSMLAFWALVYLPLPAVTYYFFSVFPASSWPDRHVPWLKVAMLALALVFAVPLAGAFLVAGSSEPLWRLRDAVAPIGRALHPAWGLVVGYSYSLGLFLLSIVSLAVNAFGDADTRRKTRVILLGTTIGITPVMLLPLAPRSFWLFAIGVISLFAIPASLGYAVVKHRAMDIPVLLRRSARYLVVRQGLVTAALVVAVTGTVAFAVALERLFDLSNELSGVVGLVAGSAFGGGLALSVRRVWLRVQERLDHAFFRSAYDARHLLEGLADRSRTAMDREALAVLLDRTLTDALHPRTLAVYLRHEGTGRLVPVDSTLEGPAPEVPEAALSGLTDLGRRGKVRLLSPSDADAEFGFFSAAAPEALVPMVGRQGALEGLLVLGSRLSDEPYSGEDTKLLASAAAQAGLALENIRLAETMAGRLDVERRAARELEIAKEVQAKLLPHDFPTLPTLDFAGFCLQAREVGGDYYDLFRLGPSDLGLVLADISGKGISAALLMASLQANLRAHTTQAQGDLGRALVAVNRTFYDSTAPNHYATLFFGVYNEVSRRLVYANCGHLPPLLVRDGGETERLPVTGPVVGLFEPWECRIGETPFGAGDLLVVFTDGVSEARSLSDEEFGEDRLATLVVQHRHAAPRALIDCLVREVQAFSAPEQFDDLTMIVAKGRQG